MDIDDFEKDIERCLDDGCGSFHISAAKARVILKQVREYKGQINTAENELIELRAKLAVAEARPGVTWSQGGEMVSSSNPYTSGVNCKSCGEQMEGDGYNTVLHCPNTSEETWWDHEPDANPVECFCYPGSGQTDSPARITEQDAKQIANSVANSKCGSFWEWYKSYGHALLNKLNADRQVPAVAVADGLVEALVQSQHQVDADGTFIGVSRQALDEAIEIIRSLSKPPHSQQSAALPVLIAARLNEAVDVLAELMDLMQGVIEGYYKPDSLTLQPARIFMHKIKFGDRCPSHENEQGGST